MAITVNQTKYAGRQANVGSIAATFDTNPTAGRSVIVCSWHYNGNPANTISSVTDNQSGNTYTQAAEANVSAASDLTQVAIYHCLNINASGTFTVTANYNGGNSSYPNIALMEVSGLLTSGALDQTGSASSTSTSTDASVSTSGATTQADELVVAACCVYASTSNAAITLAGYTNFGLENDGVNWMPGSADDQIVSTAGTQTASYSHDNTSQLGWVAAIATYKSPAGPTSGRRPLLPRTFTRSRESYWPHRERVK